MGKLTINIIKKLIKSGKIRWTNHVMIKLLQRNISQSDIEKAILDGEILEEYENDYPYPSCLIYGMNLKGEVLHVACGSNEEEVWIITAYYPNDAE